MQEEPADEFHWLKRAGAIALGDEGDRAVGDGLDAVIGESDAMGVAAEVGEHVIGAAEGTLGVDDPVVETEFAAMIERPAIRPDAADPRGTAVCRH